MRIFVGIDCGATHLRVGLIDESGKMLHHSKTDSPLKNQADKFAQIVKVQIDKLSAESGPVEIMAIGIGTPGPLDIHSGKILSSANIKNSQPIDLKGQFDPLFNVPIYFDRDTNVALRGELWQGEAVGKKEAVMLTLGSGIGGAIMMGGQIQAGSSGKAGEIGHMFVDLPIQVLSNKKSIFSKIGFASGVTSNDLPSCGLGHQGCFEAMVNSVEDIQALSLYVGYGLANVVNIFNPEKIVLAGGKLLMGDFLPMATEVMKHNSIHPSCDEVYVSYAKLGDLCGVYGAAKLAMDHHPQQSQTGGLGLAAI